MKRFAALLLASLLPVVGQETPPNDPAAGGKPDTGGSPASAPPAAAPAEPAKEKAAEPAKETPAEPAAKHEDASTKLATEQDELAADAQQLALEQTQEKVIELLEAVGEAMDDATDRLTEADTGGETIAAQTDVIEKIYEAAKERQKQSSGEGQSGAMMDMLERMMGKTPEGDKGQGKGDKPGDQGGEGMTGESDTANDANKGNAGGKGEQRRVPKAAGTAGRDLPQEFRKALDAFNRGASNLAK